MCDGIKTILKTSKQHIIQTKESQVGTDYQPQYPNQRQDQIIINEIIIKR